MKLPLAACLLVLASAASAQEGDFGSELKKKVKGKEPPVAAGRPAEEAGGAAKGAPPAKAPEVTAVTADNFEAVVKKDGKVFLALYNATVEVDYNSRALPGLKNLASHFRGAISFAQFDIKSDPGTYNKIKTLAGLRKDGVPIAVPAFLLIENSALALVKTKPTDGEAIDSCRYDGLTGDTAAFEKRARHHINACYDLQLNSAAKKTP